jgi:hypothetical protein
MLHLMEMEIGLIPHGPARCSAWQKFVASLSQIPPIGPVLPTLPVCKPFTVYNLAGDSLHGMEEVIGSIPIRSTNHFNHLEAPPFRDFVASLSQIPKPHRELASSSLILLVL